MRPLQSHREQDAEKVAGVGCRVSECNFRFQQLILFKNGFRQSVVAVQAKVARRTADEQALWFMNIPRSGFVGFAQSANPDVAVMDGVIVILQFDEDFRWMRADVLRQ